MDELRINIWDYLYRAGEPKTVSEIAESIQQEADTIHVAVNHEWFTTIDALVNISSGAGSQ